MPTIDLYWAPGSCARVPYVALEETGTDFELHVLNRYLGEVDAPEYRSVNPKAKVPALVVDGDWVITENPVIQTELSRMFPDAHLLPTGERAATEAASLMAWFASGLQPAVGRQRLPGVFFDGDAAGLERVRMVARRELQNAFTILEERLADREWLLGEWSIVDAYMLWVWFRAVGAGMDPVPFPRCADHGRRTEARPSVARVLDREESEWARFTEDGTVPDSVPAYQVGRTPAL
jgi:glutathione S-transferase